jgi:hypothetical protein
MKHVVRIAVRAGLALSASASFVVAGPPICCDLFGFDATNMLGANPAVCGKVVTGDTRAEAQTETAEDRKRATQCALEAQEQKRAFVYTYRLVAAPDMDLIVQAVFGAHGERMLMKLGLFARENIHTVEVCDSLTVLPDGRVRESGCYRERRY